MPGTPAAVTLTSIAGDRKPYVQIDSTEALIAMAQMAALEFHPWNCAPSHPDVPGRLVFDIDPGPGVPFASTIAAALELGERLDRLGLDSLCKTTGEKGLHVVVPIGLPSRIRIGWLEAKTFSRAICESMAQDQPDVYLINMSTKRRTGRIFLDYLRNDRTATAIAPLSPRARPGAPVSMPLSRTQIKRGLNPYRFTIQSAPALLQRRQPCEGYHQTANQLDTAMDRMMSQTPPTRR